MTRDEMYDLMMGLALVALGYALYQHRKAATPGNTGIVGPAIEGIPAPIEVQGDGEGGYWYDLDNLLMGTH
jgi:hypothetical protein